MDEQQPILFKIIVYYVVFIIGKYIYKKITSSTPPGPLNLPVVGYLPFIDPNKPYETLSKLADKYGPIYGLNLGRVYTVVISSSALIRKVLSMDSTTGRAPLYVTHGIMKGHGLICAEGDLWRDQRKFVANFLRQLGAQKHGTKRERLGNLIQNEVIDLIEYLKPFEYGIDPCDAIRHNLGSFVNQIVFGKSWPRNDHTWIWLQQLQEQGVKHIGIVGPLNFLPFLSLFPHYANTMKFLLDDAFLLERETRKWTQDLRKYYSDEQFHHLLADIFGAALDTTLTTIRWFFLYMAKHQNEQHKLHEAIDNVCGKHSLTLTDLPLLPRLEAAIMETQRIRSVVPLGIPHGTTTDDVVIECDQRSYRLPIGTMIVPLQWKVHQKYLDEDISNGEDFKPSRFIECFESETRIKRNVEDFIPFQLGKRMCVGDELAKMMLFLFCGGVLQKFNMSVADDETVDMTGECGITLTPKKCKLVFKYREIDEDAN